MTCLISMTSIKSIKSMTAMPHWLDSIIKQTTPFHDQGIGILIIICRIILRGGRIH